MSVTANIPAAVRPATWALIEQVLSSKPGNRASRLCRDTLRVCPGPASSGPSEEKKKKNQRPPPLSYIGISKLSCYACCVCWELIRSLGEKEWLIFISAAPIPSAIIRLGSTVLGKKFE